MKRFLPYAGSALGIVSMVGIVTWASTALQAGASGLPSLATACIFRSETCSLAFGTWALAFVTGCAFVAASAAALYTGRLLGIENDRVISVIACGDDAHSSAPTVASITVGEDGKLTTKSPGMKESPSYAPVLYEVINLGRTPLLRLSAKCGFERGNLKSDTVCDVTIGDIAEHGVAHIGVYVHTSHPAEFALDFTDVTSERGKVGIHGADPSRPGKVHGSVSTAVLFGNSSRRTALDVASELTSELRGIKNALTGSTVVVAGKANDASNN